VNQAYCIGTSTKVAVKGIKTDKFTDAYFSKSKDKEGEKLAAERKADQKSVDEDIKKQLDKSGALKKYLKARFSLTNGMLPHEMKF
jgi:large subunit ribosomal protein L6e